MMYNKTVQSCFFSPQHIGVLDLNQDFSVAAKSQHKGQAMVEFYMQCGPDRFIRRACFKTNGNPYLIAGLEWLCRQLEGQSLDKLPPIDYQLLVKELDIPVTQYPLALRVVTIFKEILMLMNSRFVRL